MIYIFRGEQVMLDSDLAAIYGYTTKDFNRQVKNNAEKFDEDFMFQLNDEETRNLRCKNFTSNEKSTLTLKNSTSNEEAETLGIFHCYFFGGHRSRATMTLFSNSTTAPKVLSPAL